MILGRGGVRAGKSARVGAALRHFRRAEGDLKKVGKGAVPVSQVRGSGEEISTPRRVTGQRRRWK